jgi:hypothetical protein
MALRDPRDDAGADERDGRGDDDPAEPRGAGGGSGLRQIGQFSTKRLWRQKLGGTIRSLGAAAAATFAPPTAF